jgi:predicted  nucleic acid-binding Zn-ribbon protein
MSQTHGSAVIVDGCIDCGLDLAGAEKVQQDDVSDQERCVVDADADADADPVAMSVQVPALRRSKRLAERRLRLAQEKNEVASNSKVMAVVGSTCKQVLVPDLLGSTFVNGRRRSARYLKTNVDVVA